jgi:hypothetical protein
MTEREAKRESKSEIERDKVKVRLCDKVTERDRESKRDRSRK